VHETDQPDAVSHFPDPDALTGEGRTEIDLASADARVTALSHRDCAIMERIFGVTEVAELVISVTTGGS
jgi:hypothetical protein